MGVAEAPQRPVIEQSWRRAAMSGLDPGAPVDSFTIEDVDRHSRLMVAAEPILDRVAEELRDTGFSVILADRHARLVDIRCGVPALYHTLEQLGGVRGNTFVEKTTGTNSIATTYELRRGVAVHGTEHYIEAFKKFSCYGHPIIHPITQRTEGVLDITCLAEYDNALLAPFAMRSAQQIEERLLAGAGEADQLMLAAFQVAQVRDRARPVVAIGDRTLLANAAAVELLDSTDQAVLRGLAVDTPAGKELTQRCELSTGKQVVASMRRIPGTGGVLVILDAVEDRPVLPAAKVHGTAPVLIHGEPGSGRTTALRDRARGARVGLVDAGELPEAGERAWLARLDGMLRSYPIVGVEAVHLLPEAVARRLAMTLRHTTAWVLLTSAPAGDLRGEVAGLVAHCGERIELTPLRHRRDEIPAIVRSILRSLNAPRELRFTPAALEALASQSWPGNLRELHSAVREVIRTRQVGDVRACDLPFGYQGRARSRALTPMEQAERDAIVEALRACGGNKTSAAQRLGISRTTLYTAIRTLGIASKT